MRACHCTWGAAAAEQQHHRRQQACAPGAGWALGPSPSTRAISSGPAGSSACADTLEGNPDHESGFEGLCNTGVPRRRRHREGAAPPGARCTAGPATIAADSPIHSILCGEASTCAGKQAAPPRPCRKGEQGFSSSHRVDRPAAASTRSHSHFRLPKPPGCGSGSKSKVPLGATRRHVARHTVYLAVGTASRCPDLCCWQAQFCLPLICCRVTARRHVSRPLPGGLPLRCEHLSCH